MLFTLSKKSLRVKHVDDMPPDEKGSTDLEGMYDPVKRAVYISKWLDGKLRLEVEIHELIHAIEPSLQHGRVGRLGRDIAKVLWGLGWRPKQRKMAKRRHR
jgi:hypothetical protein